VLLLSFRLRPRVGCKPRVADWSPSAMKTEVGEGETSEEPARSCPPKEPQAEPSAGASGKPSASASVVPYTMAKQSEIQAERPQVPWVEATSKRMAQFDESGRAEHGSGTKLWAEAAKLHERSEGSVQSGAPIRARDLVLPELRPERGSWKWFARAWRSRIPPSTCLVARW